MPELVAQLQLVGFEPLLGLHVRTTGALSGGDRMLSLHFPAG